MCCLIYDLECQDIFREGILQIIRLERDLELVGASDPESFVSMVENKLPDVVITAVYYRETDIVAATSMIAENIRI